tara:strand:+ start:745 stop:1356 length:612 start_codon:yes stop_codon:yes gene_type:complete
MNKTELIIIRHGETEWNKQRRMQGHLNSNLSKLGESQIILLGKWMEQITFKHIYCSDSPRARKTAEAITKFSGNDLKIDKRLREKNLGVFEGLTSDEAMELYPEVFHQFKTAGAEYVIKNGESTKQLFERAHNFIEEIRINHPNERVVIVTHGGVIRVLVKHILGISLDYPTYFKIMNTSLFHFYWDEKWMISQMGVISHLEV